MMLKMISIDYKFLVSEDRLEVCVSGDCDVEGGGFNSVKIGVVINKRKEELFSLTLNQIEEIAIDEAKKSLALVE
jgi:hypothetical protein